MTPFLKELLLISNPNVLALSSYLNSAALLFILPCFYLAMAMEFLTNWKFKDVAKRTMIAFLAIKLLTPIHLSFVDTSLNVSSKILKEYSPRNKFLTAYKTTKMDKNSSMWTKLSSIVVMIVSDPIVLVIFLTSYVAFFLLTQLYSLVYHLAIAFIGLCALLSIFPMTSGSLAGAIKTSLWCVLMPFVVTIVLCLIGDSDAFLKTYTGGIVQNVESLIQLLVMTILLLMTPMITSKLMSEAGVLEVAENLGEMAAKATMAAGAGILGAKVLSGASAAKGMTVNPVLNHGKSLISSKASEIMQKKGIAPKVSSVSKSGGLGELVKAKGEAFKHVMQGTSLKEKMTLGADAIVNRQENKLAKLARSQDAEQAKDHPQVRHDLMPLSSYKREVLDFFRNTGNSADKFNLNKGKFIEFHQQKGGISDYLGKLPKEETYIHKDKNWKKFSPEIKQKVQETYGSGKEFRGRNNFVYFPRSEGKAPVPLEIYSRTMKPKTIKEIHNEKSFLNGQEKVLDA